MTPERWRTVDAILNAALACGVDQRNAVVAAACGADEALCTEVASLLAAHEVMSDGFLEQQAAQPLLATDSHTRSPDVVPVVDATARRRTVSARATLYVATVMLFVGMVAGLLVDRSSLVRRWANGAATSLGTSDAAVVTSPATAGTTALAVVDRTGRLIHAISATRPWTPRFSPDGLRVAYGAFGAGRETSDLWVTDLDAGTTRRVTDGDADANDPQWSADGASIAFSASAPGGKDVMLSRIGGAARVLASRPGTQFPSDWHRDGRALLVTEEVGDTHDILVQLADGSPALPYAATAADETAARFSPDGRWVAYTSDDSGRPEVYLDSYPLRGHRVLVSSGGGVHPVWRGDGRELYYWRAGSLVAVQLAAASGGIAPARGAQTVLFRAKYEVGVSTMYDVSPDGQHFVIVQQP